MTRKIPPYLYRKNNLVILVVFTAVFALLFINIYTPFTSTEWYPISKFEYFLYSSLITLTGVLVVVISRFIMYVYTKKRTISYPLYALWILIEIIFMSLFYTFYSYTLEEMRNFWSVFESSIVNTSLVILLPYSICTLYFSRQEKSRQLKEMERGELSKENTHETVSFYDERGEMRFSIKKEKFLYAESADNYVTIWYLGKNNQLSSYLLRNTLKSLEESLSDYNVLRTHRSYMVNMDQVKIIKRGKEGIYLDLGVERVPDIPASKSYAKRVTDWFLKYS